MRSLTAKVVVGCIVLTVALALVGVVQMASAGGNSVVGLAMPDVQNRVLILFGFANHKLDYIGAVVTGIQGNMGTLIAQDESTGAAVQRIEVELAKKGISPSAIKAAEAYHNPPMSAEQRAEALRKWGDKYVEMRQQLETWMPESSELVAQRDLVLERLNDGDFSAATKALAGGLETVRGRAVEANRARAELLANIAIGDHLQHDYHAAAQKYAEAAEAVASFDPHAQWRYMLSQAEELQWGDRNYKDVSAITESIKVVNQALTFVSTTETPADWAETKYLLGVGHGELGVVQDKTAELEKAYSSFLEARDMFPRERNVKVWTDIRAGLAGVLIILGERQRDVGKFEAAAEIVTPIAAEFKDVYGPRIWSKMQWRIGLDFWTAGESERGTKRLEEARTAFEAAVIPEDDWYVSGGLNDLIGIMRGNMLGSIALRENDMEKWEEALIVIHKANTERVRALNLRLWVDTRVFSACQFINTIKKGKTAAVRLAQEAASEYSDLLTEQNKTEAPKDYEVAKKGLDIINDAIRTGTEAALECGSD